ncbi:MAG: proton-conducting transporter membrane subunit, partial [Cypionkella sp.]
GVYPVAMFHLFTHAFFKAMLFLGAGSVIHAMHHEQDLRNYGGLRKKIPLTFWAMMIGTLAITGVGIPLTYIGFAGFLSKDAVIESAFVVSDYAFVLLVFAAFMTSFYSWRLMFMTFFGSPRGDAHTHDHAHESPKSMLIPLGALSLGAVYGNFFGDEDKVRAWFGMEPAAHAQVDTAQVDSAEMHADGAQGDAAGHDLAGHDTAAPADMAAAAPHGAAPKGAIYFAADNTVLHDAHYVPKWVKVSPFIAMLLGLGLAYLFYIKAPHLPGALARNQRPLYLFLLNKWYFDEIYDWLFVRPAQAVGRFLWKKGDGAVIDGGLNGIALGIVPLMTRIAARAQSGYVFTYAFAMVLGIAALITWMTLFGGR